jgi:type IV secretion system protein VirB10
MTGQESEEAGERPPKAAVAPQSLTLRSAPPQAARLKRGAVVAAAGTLCAALAGVGWMAFEPVGGNSVQSADDNAANAAPVTVTGVPATYDGVPALGPGLPGDLGRPILAMRRRIDGLPPGETRQEPGQFPQPQRGSIPDRGRENQDAARSAALMVAISARPFEAEEGPSRISDAASPADPGRLALAPETDPNAQQRKADFLNTADRRDGPNPHLLAGPLSPNMIMAGSIIPASLITGINSDLPGLVTAQVTERVFDSMTGAILLIPQGTRLIGSYDSVIAYGQKRALVVWQRLIFPDGSALAIDNVPGTDPSGKSGLVDQVNAHGLALLKGAAISTLLGVGPSLSISGESDLAQAIRQSTEQNISRAGDQLVSRNLQIQPSLSIRPGAPVRLIVHRDLILKPWERAP